MSRKRKNRPRVSIRANSARRFVAIHKGHADIHDDDIVADNFLPSDRNDAIFCNVDLSTSRIQYSLKETLIVW